MEQQKQTQGKPHWTDDIKFHDPDYPLKWAVAIFSWQILAVFVGFWILVNILPWNAIGQIPGYSNLTYWVNEIIPLHGKIPEEFRYSGLQEQITAINFFGFIYLFFVLLKTGNFPTKSYTPWWSPPALCFGGALLFSIVVISLMSEGSISEAARKSWGTKNTNEWRTTLEFISYWYGIGIILVCMVAGFRTTVGQIYNFLRNK